MVDYNQECVQNVSRARIIRIMLTRLATCPVPVSVRPAPDRTGLPQGPVGGGDRGYKVDRPVQSPGREGLLLGTVEQVAEVRVVAQGIPPGPRPHMPGTTWHEVTRHDTVTSLEHDMTWNDTSVPCYCPTWPAASGPVPSPPCPPMRLRPRECPSRPGPTSPSSLHHRCPSSPSPSRGSPCRAGGGPA